MYKKNQEKEEMNMIELKRYSGIAFAILVIISGIFIIFSYNNLITLDENTAAKWSNVEVQYQRRADLIPNLVNVVKGYASHEKETLEELTKLRTKTFQLSQNNIPTADQLKQFDDAQVAMTAALTRLIAVAENYPDLKANQNFLELQAQLEGTENRIAVARKDFNDAVKAFNTSIRRFPNNCLSSLLGFESKAYLQSQNGAADAPQIAF